jgi:hypothetical protein
MKKGWHNENNNVEIYPMYNHSFHTCVGSDNHMITFTAISILGWLTYARGGWSEI